MEHCLGGDYRARLHGAGNIVFFFLIMNLKKNFFF